ncbi:predicted protein, partial [Nematostella vectensis]
MTSSVVNGGQVYELSKHLNCSLCHRLIRGPKLLPCLHSFCLACLEDLVTENDVGFNCPQCHTEAKVSKAALRGLPTNFFLDNMLDIALMNSSDSKPVPCTNCDLNATANSRCLDCGEFLCVDCYNVHKRIRQTKEHRIMTISELLASNTEEILSRVAYCNTHTTEPLKYYCESCNLAACRDCLIIEHREHKYNYIKDAKKVKKQKATLENLLEGTVVQIPLVEKAAADIRHMHDMLHGKLATVKSEIRETSLRLIKVIKDREQTLLAEADEIYESKSTVLEKQRENLELQLMRLKTASEFSQQVMKFANEVEFLSLKEPIIERLNTLCESHPVTRPRENEILKYDVDLIDSETTVARALGKVKTYVPQSSGVPANNHDITNGNKVDKSNPAGTLGDVISVEIKDVRGTLVYPEIVHLDERQACVRYTPTSEGILDLNVFSRGELLSGFPIEITYVRGRAVSLSDPVPRGRNAKQAFVGSGSRFGRLSDPQDVAVDKNGHVIVCDSKNHRIQ